MPRRFDPRPIVSHTTRPVRRLILVTAFVACAVVYGSSPARQEGGRSETLVRLLANKGLIASPSEVVWMDEPPFALHRALSGSVPAVLRARAAADEPNDIFMVHARLSKEGALLSASRVFNLTETSAVDEGPPLGGRGRAVFVEQPLMAGSKAERVRLIEFGSADSQQRDGWSNAERVKAGITRWQQTGSWDGIRRYSYSVEPAPKRLTVVFRGDELRVAADDRTAHIDVRKPLGTPEWLTVEPTVERRPGSLVTWAVDRVRAEIGDNAMQYIKAIAFSALDVVLSGKEAVSNDTGEGDIAADLGQESLDPVVRQTPVDPVSGFPPPPLTPWVKPTLPGEGQWRPKDKDPFIRTLPGLPPVFYTTFIRSDRRRKVTRVYIALWDPRVVELNMMAGVAEPKSATGQTGPGIVPREPSVMRRLVAACNAGFQSLHGEYGMMSDGVVYLPPKPYAATVAKLRDGSIAFGTWPDDATIPDDFLSYRQNMTVMVQDGKFNPYGRTWWGGTPDDWEDKTHTVRTGICRTKENFVGYFYGADLSPKALARAMIQARCDYGIALDMNAGHSGLEYYVVSPEAEMKPLGRHVNRDWEREGDVRGLDGWKFRARRLIRGMGLMHFPRYIRREGRDFFYLTARHLLPGPPLRVKDDADEAVFEVKGLPQHGYPYAAALADAKLTGDKPVRVLKLDPRLLTVDEKEAVQGAKGAEAIVAAVPPIVEPSSLSLWFSDNAVRVSAAPLARGSLRLATGRSVSPHGVGRAALGVQADEGMLVYAELTRDGDSLPMATAAALAEPLRRLGCGDIIVLDEPWGIALGGDGDLSGKAVRPPEDSVRLWRKAGAGARRIFADTPVVPLKHWFPLQAKRVRYFKKPKKKEAP